ncbi:hypothetical protein RFI_16430, partial [Reticulomyxa filosa]
MADSWVGFVCQYKKSGWLSRYDFRFAVIKNGHLYIYTDESQFKKQRNALESIPLRRATMLQEEEPRHPFVILIKDREELHRLSLETSEDLDQCMAAIKLTQRVIFDIKHPFGNKQNKRQSVVNYSSSANTDMLFKYIFLISLMSLFFFFFFLNEKSKKWEIAPEELLSWEGPIIYFKLFCDDNLRYLDKACEEVLKGLNIPAQKRQEMLATLSTQQRMEIVMDQMDSLHHIAPSSIQTANTSVSTASNNKNTGNDRNVSYWIKQLRVTEDVTAEVLVDVSDRLIEEGVEWLQEFIHEQGLTLLIQSMPRMKGKTEYEIEFLRCLRAIMDKRNVNTNDKIGLKFIVRHEYALQAIIDLLDNEDLGVRLLIIKLVSAVCWHDEMGFDKVIECLNQYAKDKHLTSIWEPFVHPLLPMATMLQLHKNISLSNEITLDDSDSNDDDDDDDDDDDNNDDDDNDNEFTSTEQKQDKEETTLTAMMKHKNCNSNTVTDEDEKSVQEQNGRPIPSFEFQLYTIGLLNAILNSFPLEDRVTYRKQLGALGIDNVLQAIEAKIEGINVGYSSSGMDADPLIAKMEEQLELYRSVESIDIRASTLGNLDMTSPQDLFGWLDSHAISDGY